jgi:hypothetical protein
MTPITLSASDLQLLKADSRFSAAHAALLDIMIQRGEVVLKASAAPQTAPAPQGVQA